MVQDTAQRLGITENELVNTCVFDTLSDNSKFIVCPFCENFIALKALLPVSEGIAEFDCKCGTHIWWDAESDKVLKFKTK